MRRTSRIERMCTRPLLDDIPAAGDPIS